MAIIYYIPPNSLEKAKIHETEHPRPYATKQPRRNAPKPPRDPSGIGRDAGEM